MGRILFKKDLKNVSRFTNKKIKRSLWTCLIPAAGRGTRLGYILPKVLYPILEKPILHYLVQLFEDYCTQFIVVASPEGAQKIEKELKNCCNSKNFSVAIQEEPKGMAHAVWQAKDIIQTPYTVVVWGDQICLRDETISSTLAFHQSGTKNALTFPTVIKRDPYIHFQRDYSGRIIKVLQKRENEITEEFGETDCGFFGFSTNLLFSVLQNGFRSPMSLGAQTKEVNLLQLFPKFEIRNFHVNSLRIAYEEETHGINTLMDAQKASSILRNRK